MLSKLLANHKSVEIGKMRAADFFAKHKQFDLDKLKKVENGHGWKEVTACPVCKGTNSENALTVYGIPLVRCTDCDARYHTKVPKDPNDIYQDNYAVYNCDDFEENYQYRMKRFGGERVELLRKYCGDLSTKSLIDIGCGDGIFLSAAKGHFEHCVGSDFSQDLCEFTQNRTGLKVYQDTLDKIPETNFDVVTSFDVIEHVHDPLKFMEDINHLMKKGGHLLIYTPNYDSFSVKVMQEHSQLLDGTEHIVLFSYESLKKIGELSGFEVVHTETRGLDIHSLLAYQQHFYPEENSGFLTKWNNELQAMIDQSGAADYIRVIYKKI